MYTRLLRPLLFRLPGASPEWLHQQTLRSLAWMTQPGVNEAIADQPSVYQAWLQRTYTLNDPRLQQSLWGLQFANPLGLAAGFDKDGVGVRAWTVLGFGFAELGTVTFHPQPGNPRPRLFRLPDDRAALNRMGFNNLGAAALAERLQQLRSPQAVPIPIGINLGKSKITPLDQAASDYQESFKLLQNWGDYFVVNVSSPNTPGLRSLQAADQLAAIVDAIQQINQNQKPLLVKISPDLDWEAIAAIVNLAVDYQLAGLIATNTTLARTGLKTRIVQPTGQPVTAEAGGLSGAPLRSRSTEVIRFIWQQTQGQLPIVGVGGVFTAADAWEKITAGASLVQVYTGWIYEGPGLMRRISQGLLQKLAAHQLNHIGEAVGWSHRSAQSVS
ncbi:quinone-dependent dihydroorotate dehydrogenase [Sphaerothrix gracilis]|uniref:quinone-dependent dihydroorotate dehydrogenase n=1 Tax=Sphaerothrix gracilis TaxID=3151835 RepID=UPI0031FC58AD